MPNNFNINELLFGDMPTLEPAVTPPPPIRVCVFFSVICIEFFCYEWFIIQWFFLMSQLFFTFDL
jgi:hypothetical protein